MKRTRFGRRMITVIAVGWTTLALITAFFIWPYLAGIENVGKINHVLVNSSNIDRKTHAHATLAIFVNGNLLNFTAQKYQNRDMLMHFENGDGFTLHKHSRNAWLEPFLESLNMKLANDCITLDNDSSYCTNFNNQVSFEVNGEPNKLFEHYTPRDGDKILVSYGKANELVAEQIFLDSVKVSSLDEK